VLSLGADQTAPELAADGTASVLVFDLTLDQAPVAPVTVDWSLVSGTATAGTDFLTGSGVATFAPGETTTQIVVTVADDTEVEFTEDFTVALSNVVGATAPATLTMSGSITDDDAPVVSVANATPLAEGNTGARTAHSFTISLDRPSVYPVTVNWAAANGTAVMRSDFVAGSGTVNIPAGSTSATVAVTVYGDTIRESDETFAVNLTGVSNGNLGTSSGVGTILDDETLPEVSVNNINVTEGNSGTTPATFTVTLSKAPLVATTVMVDILASASTPKASIPADVTMTRTKVTFAPGQTTAQVTASVVGDLVKEGNEKFSVRLSTPTKATLKFAVGTATILNDD
jgi:hypothetical protein